MLKLLLLLLNNVIAERRRFRQRAQGLDEGVEDFITGLRGLAITCNYGSTLDESLRDQLVERASSFKVRERLLLEGSALTLDKAIRIATQVEKCQREVQLMSGDSACVQEVWKRLSFGDEKKHAYSENTVQEWCYLFPL